MLSTFDYAVVVFYLLFLTGIGWFFRNTGKDSSEYFRGGGKMAWWMVGASAFMSAFSAWTFTGAAGLAYDYGLVVLVLYWANALGFFLNWSYFARWCRNTRTITALEAVRQRLGPANEQVFTWLQVPFQILQAGIWLYGLAIFCTPVFGLDLRVTILICGIVVVFLAAAGGSWAVVTGDFIQALVLVPVTLVAAFSAIRYVGWDHLTATLPKSHWQLSNAVSGFGPWWIIAVLLEKVTNINGLQYSSRYLCVRDGATARKAALLSGFLFLVGSIFWFIPPLAARAGGLDLKTIAGVTNPAEMSYIVMAAVCLPAGLLGLLVTGIISSTMSSMDTGLNRNAGIFIRSFYLPILRPSASERELVFAGRLTTWGFGFLVILMALFYSTWRDLGVFQLMMNFSALVATPYAVPLFWCLLVRRSPDWAAWSSIILCCITGLLVTLLPRTDWATTLPAQGSLSLWIDWIRTHEYVAITVANVAVGSVWFLGASALFGTRHQPVRRQGEVREFFRKVDTDVTAEEGGVEDHARHLGIARMCFAYGGFITLLAVFSGDWSGRLGLGFCALFMLSVGACITAVIRRTIAKQTLIS